MSGSAPFLLSRSGMLLALISAAFAHQAGAAAGRVDFTTPGVTVAGRDGQAKPLAKGTELDSGDTVRTNDGRAQIRFTDGSYVSLQPNTDFAISDYKFEGKDDDRGFFGLVKGAMRTVTGAVGRVNRNSYRITTPTATVGIRGTGGVVQILPSGATLVIGTSGIWSLTNPAGSIDIPAGVSGLAPTQPNTPPTETNTQPQTNTPPPQPVKVDFNKGDEVNEEGKNETIFVATEEVTPPSTLPLPPPPPLPPLVTGAGYTPLVAYTYCDYPCVRGGDNGQGVPLATSAIFNETGQMTGLNLDSNQWRIGAGTHAEFGTDGILAWGRWVGTVNTQAVCEGTCPTHTFGPEDGFHYVIGKVTAVMPTLGTAVMYSAIGGSNPTDGSVVGSLVSATLKVNFEVYRVEADVKVTMSGQSYGISGSTTSGSSVFLIESGVTITGPSGICTGGCSGEIKGFFAGASAERAGIGYLIRHPSTNIIGAAALKRN